MERVVVLDDFREFMPVKATGFEGIIIGSENVEFLRNMKTPIIRLDSGDYIRGLECRLKPVGSEDDIAGEEVTDAVSALSGQEPDTLDFQLRDIYQTFEPNRGEIQRSVMHITRLDNFYSLIKPIPVIVIEYHDNHSHYFVVENPVLCMMGDIIMVDGKTIDDALESFRTALIFSLDHSVVYGFNMDSTRLLLDHYVSLPDKEEIERYRQQMRSERKPITYSVVETDENDIMLQGSARTGNEPGSYEPIEESALELRVDRFVRPFNVQIFKRSKKSGIYMPEGIVYSEGGNVDDCIQAFQNAVPFQFEDLRQLAKRTPQQQKKLEVLASYKSGLSTTA